jgi:hypothetical protein
MHKLSILIASELWYIYGSIHCHDPLLHPQHWDYLVFMIFWEYVIATKEILLFSPKREDNSINEALHVLPLKIYRTENTQALNSPNLRDLSGQWSYSVQCCIVGHMLEYVCPGGLFLIMTCWYHYPILCHRCTNQVVIRRKSEGGGRWVSQKLYICTLLNFSVNLIWHWK